MRAGVVCYFTSQRRLNNPNTTVKTITINYYDIRFTDGLWVFDGTLGRVRCVTHPLCIPVKTKIVMDSRPHNWPVQRIPFRFMWLLYYIIYDLITPAHSCPTIKRLYSRSRHNIGSRSVYILVVYKAELVMLRSEKMFFPLPYTILVYLNYLCIYV